MTLISNRDQGVMAADEILGSSINHLICCFHLKANFCKQYSRILEGHFWTIANAKTGAEFHQALEELRAVNISAPKHLEGVDSSLWVTAYAGITFGHKTSNVVESMNRVLKSERELSILDLLNEIWHLIMNQRFKRYSEVARQDGWHGERFLITNVRHSGEPQTGEPSAR